MGPTEEKEYILRYLLGDFDRDEELELERNVDEQKKRRLKRANDLTDNKLSEEPLLKKIKIEEIQSENEKVETEN